MIANPIFADPLTGVYSRSRLNESLEHETDRARRYGEEYSIVFMDVDHFKSINDAFGHSCGDQVLVEFSQRLIAQVRKADEIFRYGGDEFIILLPRTSKAAATRFAQRVLEELAGHPIATPSPIWLTFSAGIACFPEDGATFAQIFEVADQRHYLAKQNGRSQVVGQSRRAEPPLAGDIERLIERDQALDVLQHFLNRLPEEKRGVLQVEGGPGSGKSRFLSHVEKLSQMQGYAVLHLHGGFGLSRRVFGALDEARRTWPELPSPLSGAQAFCDSLANLLAAKYKSGLIVLLDEPAEMDQASLDFWQEYFFAESIPCLALISTGSKIHPETALLQRVELNPLSPQGVKVWLRQCLNWEAPAEFVRWLHRETGGNPGRIQGSLKHLVEQKMLNPYQPGALNLDELPAIHLADWLAQSSRLPPNHLPLTHKEFIGREDELHSLKQLMLEHNLVVLSGPGGVGKTALAVQAAAECLAQFAGGVFFVPLVSLRSPEHAVYAIIHQLGLDLSGRASARSQLIHYLRGRSLLLVLDNYEQLLPDTDLLFEIHQQAPQCCLLVTSRYELRLPDQKVLNLEGLPYPESDSPQSLESYSAIQLFTRLATERNTTKVGGAAYGSGQPNRSLDLQLVARICRMLAGAPLGIELAAAWAQTLPLEEILAAVQEDFASLSSEQENILEHHRSLVAVLDSLWHMFSPDEQRILTRLALFRADFSGEAARQVCGASPFFLDALAARETLRRSPEGRYEMHELVRQFARNKLKAHPEEREHALERYAAFYAATLARLLDQLKGGRQVEALDLIGLEIENARQAWDWAVTHQRWALIEQMVEPFFHFFEIRSWFGEGLQLFQPAARAAAEYTTGELRGLAGRLLCFEGWFNGRSGTAKAGYEHLELAVRLLRVSGPSSGLALALNLLGYQAYYLGRPETARQILEEGLGLYRQLNDRWGQAFALNYLGHICRDAGEFAQGRLYYQQSLEIRRAIQDQNGLAITLNNLGSAACEGGDYAAAEDLHQESLSVQRRLNNSSGTMYSLYNLGLTSWLLGNYAAAREFLEESLQLGSQTGDQAGWADASCLLGTVEAELGEGDSALHAQERLQEALAAYQKLGSGDKVCGCQARLGLLLLEQKQPGPGADLLHQALQLGQSLPQTAAGPLDTDSMLTAHSGLARAARERHELYPAREHLRGGLGLCLHAGLPYLALDLFYEVALWWAAAGELRRGYALLGYIFHHPATRAATFTRVQDLMNQIAAALYGQSTPVLDADSIAEMAARLLGEI